MNFEYCVILFLFIAAETFFIKCRSKEKYKDYGLTARALEKSKSVKVENLPAQCPEDLLELYFDKWGGMVERIDTIPNEQAAIVTFHDQEGKHFFLCGLRTTTNELSHLVILQFQHG